MRLLLLMCIGCGAGVAQSGTETEAEAESETEVEVETESGAETVEAETEAEVEAETEPCSTRADCGSDERCIWDQRARACRLPQNECERTRPFRSDERGFESVDFRRGDPCAVQNPACAYDVGRTHCVPFERITRCPDTLEGARAAGIYCMHPDQSALGCEYEGHWCGCHAPAPYCGGAPPGPGFFNRPNGSWGCLPDIDAQGCPTRGVDEGERCSPNGQECMRGCDHLMECRRGRWRLKQVLPPRP